MQQSCRPSRVSKATEAAPRSTELPWIRMTEDNMPPLKRHLMLYQRNGSYSHGMCLKKDKGVLVDGVTYPLARFSHYLVCSKPEGV